MQTKKITINIDSHMIRILDQVQREHFPGTTRRGYWEYIFRFFLRKFGAY